MKVAVSAKGQSLEDRTDPAFGRCPYFVLIDPESLRVEVVENAGGKAAGGAGIEAAQQLARHHVDVVVTGEVGPNAARVLVAAGIRVVTGARGTVREAIEGFAARSLPGTGTATTRQGA